MAKNTAPAKTARKSSTKTATASRRKAPASATGGAGTPVKKAATVANKAMGLQTGKRKAAATT